MPLHVAPPRLGRVALARRRQVRRVDGARLGRRRLELPAEHEGEEVLLRRQQHEVVLDELQEIDNRRM